MHPASLFIICSVERYLNLRFAFWVFHLAFNTGLSFVAAVFFGGGDGGSDVALGIWYTTLFIIEMLLPFSLIGWHTD